MTKDDELLSEIDHFLTESEEKGGWAAPVFKRNFDKLTSGWNRFKPSLRSQVKQRLDRYFDLRIKRLESLDDNEEREEEYTWLLHDMRQFGYKPTQPQHNRIELAHSGQAQGK